ncbi:MAG: PKD domain-containing protein [Bacteroidetes bacterium]|nr:MAG: PKD domain-containing protein [Bacteroidota bacterium]
MRARIYFVLTLFLLLFSQKSNAQCDATFTLSDRYCSGDTLQIAAVPGLLYEQWDLGNGDTSSGALNYVLGSGGNYIIRHIVEDNLNCRDTAWDTITVYSRPDLSFSTDQNCTDDSVFFTSAGIFDLNDTVSIRWFFGDGDSTTGLNPVHSYSNSGYYTLQTKLFSLGCEVLKDTQVFIQTRPQTSFSASAGACLGDTMLFTHTGTSYNSSLRWNFGDPFSGQSNTDSIANPRHRFSLAGTYLVRLVLTDTLNCRDTFTSSYTVYGLPQANFTVNNTCKGNGTQFTNSSTAAGGDTLASYAWTFGDSNSDTLASPLHVYVDTGDYPVQFIVTSTAGCIDTVQKQVSIYEKPVITSDLNELCQNGTINFSKQFSNDTITAYAWSFGDGYSSTNTAPAHQYASAGNFKPSLRVTFPNGKGCRSDSLSIQVNALPAATLIINSDTQCFNGNEVCLYLSGQSSNIKTRRVLYDDGFVDVSNGPTDTFSCHSYSNTDGGLYSITAQLIDSNNCSVTLNADEEVLIYPQIAVAFDYSTDAGCFETTVDFYNTSNSNPPQIVSYQWDFGDGNTNSSNWTSVSHTYINNGNFTAKLTATDLNGCTDSVLSTGAISNTTFNVDARIDSVTSTCVSNNKIFASQTPIPGASISWNWGNAEDTSKSFSASFAYQLPGIYYPSVSVNLNGCDSSYVLDTLEISGPLARIGPITNRYQCQITDTVYFNNGTNYYNNIQRRAIWNFGDAFAPSCTTDTYNGINTTANCRFSVDSISAKHMYSPGEENCYYVRLIAYDSVLNCTDTVTESVPLMSPIASKTDSLFLTGLLLNRTQTCIGPEEDKTVTVDLTQTQPRCGRQGWQVMWDSTCAAQSGNFNSFWITGSTEHNYTYDNPPCDPDGFVTIGLIIQNGDDSSGTICRDTAWYHNFLEFAMVDPRFSSDYNASEHYCEGSSFTFSLVDTVQDDVVSTEWIWGDGTSTLVSDELPVQHQFNESGTFTVINLLTTNTGCIASDTHTVNIGLNQSIAIQANPICLRDTLYFSPQVYYINDGFNYFNDSARLAQGKEAIFYDMGEGSGFQNLGANPSFLYTQPGNYAMRIAFRDSSGCMDTFTFADSIRIYGVYANFETADDSFICAQAIAFTDLSSVVDSSSGMTQNGDALVSWTWEFGNGVPNSILSNPEVFLNAGNYAVELRVENTVGCRDSITKNINVTGPEAFYVISNDTTGCSPHEIVFLNQSSNANNYVWSFNDSANNTLITGSDSSVSFVYENYGVFQPTLTAQGNFIQNGINVSCSISYPDSTQPSIRLVAIKETPIAEFSYSADCASKGAQFAMEGTVQSTTLTGYLWEFGDGDTSSAENPLHIYPDTGSYEVILHVYTAQGCEDTVMHTVVIAPNPIAWFSYSEECLGATTLFEDSTDAFNDLIYDWQWDFGDGATSTLEDPFHDYAKDTFYTVQLVVTNIGGCRDTAIREIRIHSYPVADFTVSPSCDYDSSVFVNSSSNSELPLDYTWTFGDGQSSNEANPKHLYAGQGNYSIQLKAVSPWGCSDSISKSQQVYLSPQANFNVSDTIYCEKNQQFVFTDLSQVGDGNNSRVWDFGDASNSTDSVALHTYLGIGNFNLQLVISTDLGCSDTLTQVLRVDPNPVAAFNYITQSSCENNNAYQFFDQSQISSGTVSLTWNLDEGNGQSDSSFAHSFLDSGFKQIKLTVLSSLGCSDSITQSLYVNPNPISLFSINQDSQCLSGNQFQFGQLSTVAYGNLTYHWTFGDGYSAGLANPAHSYTLDSTYTVQLIVRSDSGCVDTSIQNAVVHPMPVANFDLDTNSLCLYANQFQATNLSSIKSGSLSYLWDYGDGTQYTGTNSTHSYTADGAYSLKLVATSAFGCSDSLNMPINVRPMPQAGWVINDSTQCFSDHSFSFQDTSLLSSGTYVRNWYLGDGDTSSSASFVKTYSQSGDYSVKLKLTSNHGCTDSFSRELNVYPQPEAAFSINDSFQCLRGNSFVFSDASTLSSGSLVYAWEFGDGDSSTTVNPIHSYATQGIYQVKLTVESNFACRDTAFASPEVFPMPYAKIGEADSLACFRDHVFTFRDSSGIAYGTMSRTWTLGDGFSDTNASLNYSYAQYGNYTVQLLQVSNEGCADSVQRAYTVHPQASAAFSVNDSIQCFAGHAFALSNQSTLANGQLLYSWDFGDGKFSNAMDTVYSYAVYGPYTVQMIANTAFGCADTTYQNLRVDPSPVAAFSVNDSTQCVNAQNIQFTDLTSLAQGIYTVTWTFGDNTGSTLNNPSKTYPFRGTFPIKLVTLSDSGCADSAVSQVIIYPKPTADFTVNDTGQCENNNDFVFTNSSGILTGSLTYTWSFGDGDTSNLVDPSHTFLYHDTFSTSLLVRSNQGCLDSFKMNMAVYPKPYSSISFNDSDQCLNTQNILFFGTSTVNWGNFQSYYWTLNGNEGMGDLDTSYHYSASGTYPIRFISETEMGCFDTTSSQVVIYPKPTAAFSVNDSDQCVNTNSFVFTNGSSISLGSLSYLWDLGDGSASTDEHPVYSFLAHDTLTSTLYAYSGFGCYDTTQRTIIVLPKPEMSFTVNDTGQCINGNDFIFTNQSTIDYGSLTYLWDLKDGSTFTTTDVQHTYAAHNTYGVQLNATSNVGCSDSLITPIVVFPKPMPAWNANDFGQCYNEQDFLFTNASTIAYGQLHYRWDFGDAAEDTNAAIRHTYASFGAYDVELLLTSDFGCVDSLTQEIRVLASPLAQYTVNDTGQCINTQNFQFSSQSTIVQGSIATQVWYFDDGNTANGTTSTHYYVDPGIFESSLIVTSDSACPDTAKTMLRVFPKPTAYFDLNDSAQCLTSNDYQVYSLAYDSSGIAAWYWDFSSNANSSDSATAYTFATPGLKTIVHQVLGNDGCKDTTETQVFVKPMPDPRFTGLRTFHCENEPALTLQVNTTGGTFTGKNIVNQEYLPRILWADTVKYWIEVNGCADSAYGYTNVYPLPKVDLGPDTLMCKTEYLVKDVNFFGGEYRWENGSNNPYRIISKPGLYSVSITNMCGFAEDELNVEFQDHNCRVYTPNVFTPNQDKFNDYYKPVWFDVDDLTFEIYNRWGQKVFAGDMNSGGWDGTYLNSPVPQDVYVVVVRYSYQVYGTPIIGFDRVNLTLLR